MFEKEVTRYWCLRCKKVSKNLRMDKCPFCRGECEKVIVKRSRWRNVGIPVVVIFGITLWFWGMLSTYILKQGNPTIGPIKGGIMWAVPCFFSALFFFMIFSVKDENIIATRVSKMKGVTPPVDTITLHRWVKKGEKVCSNCMRPVPAGTKKCPYCGYDYL